jgi:ferritin-like metal-binding protein YciE
MPDKDLSELFLDTLKDIYYAEKQILKSLPKMAKAASSAQAVEHYEISRYGTLGSWAGKLSMASAVRVLDQTLAVEKKTDETLSKIAEGAVNAEAA